MSYSEVKTAHADNLVGWFVITPNKKQGNCGGPNGHQGQIIEALGDGMYMVRWFSWMTGEPNTAAPFKLSDMQSWKWDFFNQHADWIHAGREATNGRKYPRNEDGEEDFCKDHGPYPSDGQPCPGCRYC